MGFLGGGPYYILRGHRFLNNDAFLSLKIVFFLANRVNLDGILQSVTFHLGLLFIQNTCSLEGIK